jgi:hypothetical protein
MELIEKFVEENKSNPEHFLFPPPNRGIRYMYPWLGEPFLDYYSGIIKIDNEAFRQAMYSYKIMYEMTTRHLSYILNNRLHDGSETRSSLVAWDIYNRNVLFNFTMGYRTFGSTYIRLLPSPENRLLHRQLAGYFLNESPVWFSINSADGAPMAQPVVYAAIPSSVTNQYNAYEFLRILMSNQWQFIAMHTTAYGMDVYPVNKYALIRAIDNMTQSNDSYGLNEQWGWQIPSQTKERWLEFVQSAVADVNFTHTSLRIVYEYMLPFFKGEETFEESFSRLENKLIIYVGE